MPNQLPSLSDTIARLQGMLRDGAFDVFMSEFQGESDRAAALLGAAYLDDGLVKVLRMRLLGSKKLKDSLLDQERPLGTFSARIKVAYAVGMLTDRGYHDLEIIRKIRNVSAHHSLGFSFERTDIASWSRELALPADWPATFWPDPTPRQRFNMSVLFLALIAIPGAWASGLQIHRVASDGPAPPAREP